MNSRQVLLLFCITSTIIIAISTVMSEAEWQSRSSVGALVKSIGFTGLSISSDCTVTRSPVLETLDQCMGDMPAGYCYHLSCNIIGLPDYTSQLSQVAGCGR